VVSFRTISGPGKTLGKTYGKTLGKTRDDAGVWWRSLSVLEEWSLPAVATGRGSA
jgi:hypothetical protein